MNFQPENAPAIVFLIAGLFLILKFWQGWRSGVMRQLIGVFAIIGGICAAIFGRELLVPHLQFLSLPDRQLGFVAAGILGVGVYVFVSIFASLFFKTTAQKEGAVIQFGYGFFGGVIGLARGLFVVWLMFVGLRLVGSIAELQVSLARDDSKNGKLGEARATSRPGTLIQSLAEVKGALDTGPIGATMNVLDPVPTTFARTLPKLVRVVAKPAAIERIQDAPGVQSVVQQPAFTALLRDPELAKAAQEKDYIAIMKNPRLREALNDEDLREALKTVDLNAALDFALSGLSPE